MDTNIVTMPATRSSSLALDTWPWGLLTALAAFFVAMMVQRIAGSFAFAPLQRMAPGHWTEKARLAFPGWATLALGPIFQATLWSVVVLSLQDERESGAPFLVALAAFVGAGMASARMESRVRERPVSILDWANVWAVTFLFRLHPIVIFMVFLLGLPAQFDGYALCMVLAAVGVVLVFSLGGSLAVARWTGLLRPAPTRLQAIVDLAVRRMGVERPRAYVLRWKVASALAFPFDRAVAVTAMTMDSCTDEEIAAICSHELAHLNEPRGIHFLRVAGQFAWLPLFLAGPLCGTLGEGAGWLTALGTCLLAHWFVQKVALAMERRADCFGRAHESEAGAYAKALAKLYEINLMPAVTRTWFLTHPHLYDRLLAAGITPDYPRPKPPSRWRAKIALIFAILFTFFCAVVWMAVVRAIQSPIQSH